MNKHMMVVELEKAYRILNHGPTVLISARHDRIDNVMAAAWVCVLDFAPPKLTVVIDKASKTRELIEKSREFVIQVPNVAQLALTHKVGSTSLHNEPDKLELAGVKLFEMQGYNLPFVDGCSAWLACKLVPEQHNEQVYDLFIGEIVGAWADKRIFNEGRWNFETAEPHWRSLHYVSGGQFYEIGAAQNIYDDK